MTPRITPQLTIKNYTRRKGITTEEIGVAPVVVLSWSPTVIQIFAERTGAEPAPNWLDAKRHLFFTGEVQGQPVSFAEVGVGAPSTISAMEIMIACGARIFLGLGWAGGLQPSAPVGTFLIPGKCIREEGTSFHYLDEQTEVSPDEQLAKLLQTAAQAEGVKIASGPHWTTDAIYRELTQKIEKYAQQGVLGVDMETSAMYALGQFRGVRVCNLLTISDELWDTWNPAFGTPKLRAATYRAIVVILRLLENGTLPELLKK